MSDEGRGRLAVAIFKGGADGVHGLDEPDDGLDAVTRYLNGLKTRADGEVVGGGGLDDATEEIAIGGNEGVPWRIVLSEARDGEGLLSGKSIHDGRGDAPRGQTGTEVTDVNLAFAIVPKIAGLDDDTGARTHFAGEDDLASRDVVEEDLDGVVRDGDAHRHGAGGGAEAELAVHLIACGFEAEADFGAHVGEDEVCAQR